MNKTPQDSTPTMESRKRWNEYRLRVLLIDTWSSTCGYCGLGADPDKKRHTKVMSMSSSEHGTKGCGKQWKYVSSNYVGKKVEEWCADMRPDLEYIDLFVMLAKVKDLES